MNVIYLVSYDLHDKKDYEQVVAAIVDNPPVEDVDHSGHRALLSVWLVDTSAPLAAWLAHMRAATDTDDSLLISWIETRDALTGRLWLEGTNAWLANERRRWRV